MSKGKNKKPTTPVPQSQNTPAINSGQSLPRAANHQQVRIQEYQGPVPPPALLQEFENLVPGEAKRILDRFHAQSDHRMEIEKIAVKAGARESLLGIISAFLLSAMMIVASTYCIIAGHPTSGTIFGGTGALAFAGAFIYGTRTRSKERQAKAEQNR